MMRLGHFRNTTALRLRSSRRLVLGLVLKLKGQCPVRMVLARFFELLTRCRKKAGWTGQSMGGRTPFCHLCCQNSVSSSCPMFKETMPTMYMYMACCASLLLLIIIIIIIKCDMHPCQGQEWFSSSLHTGLTTIHHHFGQWAACSVWLIPYLFFHDSWNDKVVHKKSFYLICA